jgi:hypothetical protein
VGYFLEARAQDKKMIPFFGGFAKNTEICTYGAVLFGRNLKFLTAKCQIVNIIMQDMYILLISVP